MPTFNYLQEALVYRGYGWSVFPTVGKRPVVGWKNLQSHRPNDQQIGKMFGSRSRPTGLAVILGRISGGLAVRDFDTRESYSQWASSKRTLARCCPTVATARGTHVYCRLWSGVFAKWHDGELRGSTKQYVLVPPSEHPYGGYYEWIYSDPKPSDFPLLDLGETGFIDKEYPRWPTHVKPNPRVPVQPLTPPHDILTPACVTQVVLAGRERVPSEVRDIVLYCLPTGAGERHACIFQLARYLKGLPHLADANSSDLEPIVRQWHGLALPIIRTKHWKESWSDFVDAWKRVRYPARGGPVWELMTSATIHNIPGQVAGYSDEPTRRLFSLCRNFDKHIGGGPFFLACRTAQELSGFSNQMTASRRLRAFVDAGILSLVDRGTYSPKKRMAAMYRFQPGHSDSLQVCSPDVGFPREVDHFTFESTVA